MSGQLFEGSGTKALVLISSATAVPQGFYAAFAEHLIAHGASAVLTYDYRGVAQSRPRKQPRRSIRYTDWALKDFPAALAFLKSVAPDREVVGIGQSFGGHAFAISGVANQFARYGMVASMSGITRLMRDRLAWPRMNLVGVPISFFTRTMPRWVGGEPIPSSVFRDWARWCRMKEFFFDDPQLNATERVAEITTPILAVGLEDDPWGTPETIRHFLNHHINAPVTERWYSPAMVGNQPIGHLGYFRSRFAATLWPEMTEWLLDGRLPQQEQKAA